MPFKKPRRSERSMKHVDRTRSPLIRSEDDLYTMLDQIEGDPFLLLLDSVQDTHNLGACIRTANGAGVDAVIIPKDRAATLTDAVRRIASGGAEHTAIFEVVNLSRTIDKLKKRSIWTVGTSDKAEQSLYQIDLKGPLAIIMGSEEKGIRRLIEEKCDFLATLPMAGYVECLNVSVATGVVLYEAVRQRSNK